jgi:hypothetical protein
VHEAGGLEDLVADPHASADLVLVHADDLETVVAVEADREFAKRGIHEPRHTTLLKLA